jgi:hypothetical protein
MKRIIIFVVCVLPGLRLAAQEEPGFGIKFSGFVKNDFFIDSRQTVTARNGHFLLWPAPLVPDPAGADINAQPTFNILAIQSRLTGTITGPDAFGAKTSGVLEGDFFAQANDNINLFRLRHAYARLRWTHIEVLGGQTWNPLFVTSCFPGTVSFNTGTPLQSFARNPQVRLSYYSGNWIFLVAALSQLDYSNFGIDGQTCRYIRDSATPDIHLQFHYSLSRETGLQGLDIGGGMAYKTIVPRLKSVMGPEPGNVYKVDEIVAGFTAMGYTKLTTSPVTIKLQARYGENISDLLSISGFAVKEVTDVLTGEQLYTPLKSMTCWGEIHTNGTGFQAGLFGGYLSNMGTRESMSSAGNPVYGLGTNIRYLYRLSPRILFNSGKTRLALELEYTVAGYGQDFDENYLPDRINAVGNVRGLASIYYFF